MRQQQDKIAKLETKSEIINARLLMFQWHSIDFLKQNISMTHLRLGNPMKKKYLNKFPIMKRDCVIEGFGKEIAQCISTISI